MSFVNYLLLDYAAKVVGWTYTIVWVLSYYPQVSFAINNKINVYSMLTLIILECRSTTFVGDKVLLV